MKHPVLSPDNEKIMQDFQAALQAISGPEDMFPPDNLGGIREPRNPILPSVIGGECLQLARVYDLRASRERLLGRSALIVERIDNLLPA